PSGGRNGLCHAPERGAGMVTSEVEEKASILSGKSKGIGRTDPRYKVARSRPASHRRCTGRECLRIVTLVGESAQLKAPVGNQIGVGQSASYEGSHHK